MSMTTRGRVLAAFMGLAAGSVAALVLLFALVITSKTVRAADLKGPGGACCSDLEERVAELESLAAHKGNKKMSVVVFGTIHKGILWTDVEGLNSNKGYMFDASHDPSRIGIMGESKISPNLKAGYVLEFTLGNPTAEGVDLGKAVLGFPNAPDGKKELQFGEQGMAVRQSFLWADVNNVGRFALGHTSMATDGIIEINTSNTNVAVRPLSLAPIMFGGAIAGLNVPFDGYRANLIKYETPTLAGFIASASLAEDDSWDAALRYAAEAGGFRFAAGVGYRRQEKQTLINGVNLFDLFTVDVAGSHRALSGSASVKHMQSGLFANAFYSRVDYDLSAEVGIFGIPLPSMDLGKARLTGYGGQGGIEKNWFGPGNTTFYGEWQRFSGSFDGTSFGANPTIYGLGAIQSIDAAAMDVYVTWRNVDLDVDGVKPANVYGVGAKIRF